MREDAIKEKAWEYYRESLLESTGTMPEDARDEFEDWWKAISA